MTWKRRIKIAGFLLLTVLVIYLALPQNHFIVRALIFQQVNIDDYKIFSNRTVKKGIGEPWKVSKDYNSYSLNKEQLDYFKNFRTVVYLVVKDTSLLFESYWDGYGNESISNSFSMAKSIVSLLVGCAIQDGFIKSVDEPIGNYLPEFKDGDKAKVTIKHLLTMSSGLSWDESYSTLFSLTTKGYYGNDLPKLVLNQSLVKEPGKLFEYRSGDTQLLSLIVEKATGKSLSDYASERIWTKIGAEHDALWCLDKENGVEKAFCCFNSNARDFARFGQLLLNNGQWNGVQIVPAEYLKESFTPVNYLIDAETGKPCNFYGYQWWMINFEGHNVVYARGLLGQYIFAIPDLNAVIVRLGHVRNSNKIDGHPEDVHMYLKYGIDIINSTIKSE
ncbi:MAG: serine hydrolase domain-containing protein [Bacteroidales bacterium]